MFVAVWEVQSNYRNLLLLVPLMGMFPASVFEKSIFDYRTWFDSGMAEDISGWGGGGGGLA